MKKRLTVHLQMMQEKLMVVADEFGLNGEEIATIFSDDISRVFVHRLLKRMKGGESNASR